MIEKSLTAVRLFFLSVKSGVLKGSAKRGPKGRFCREIQEGQLKDAKWALAPLLKVCSYLHFIFFFFLYNIFNSKVHSPITH